MPSPDDPNNLKFNLDTLANLLNKKGSKLSYNETNGRFSIQEPGFFSQSVARTIGKQSVTSDESFGSPIRELFAVAHWAIGGLIKKADIEQAINGLQALRSSYSGEKLAILDAVIEDAGVGVKKDSARAIKLRESYKNYLKFGLAQVMFLPESNPGVCYSFTAHWARRILMGKTYLGVSKKKTEVATPLTLDAQQKVRIMGKVDKAIGPMQAALKEASKESKATALGTQVMNLGQNSTDDRLKKYFGTLIVLPVCTKQSIGANARGSEIMEEVLVTANKDGKPATIFLVNLRNNTEAHTIGIHCQGALHFFDSNLGEFAFPNGSDDDRDNFLDEWWQTFYMLPGQGVPVQYFNRWGLDSVQLKKQQ